jgi:hypothetical protein
LINEYLEKTGGAYAGAEVRLRTGWCVFVPGPDDGEQAANKRHGTYTGSAEAQCVVRIKSPDVFCRRNHVSAHFLRCKMAQEE